MGQKFNQASFDYNFFEEREREKKPQISTTPGTQHQISTYSNIHV